MREIKFRAWHKTWSAKEIDKSDWHSPDQKINGMQSVKSLGYSSHGNFWVHLEDWASACSADDVHLMQFTGLFDKNGKEIYEGDIVNYTPFANESKKTGPIEWAEKSACFYFRSPDTTFTSRLLDGREAMEVVGNIYENPDLLTN